MHDFPKALPVERGCGEREKGGIYLEMGLSRQGLPFDWFLVDPPQPPPEGLDLVNKPQLWSPDPEAEPPLYHVLVWVGAEFYPTVCDFIEEARRFGISRRIRSNFEFEKLTPGKSRMVLIHPRAINALWQTQLPPRYCPKEARLGHLELAPNPAAGSNPTAESAGNGVGPDFYQVTVLPPEREYLEKPEFENKVFEQQKLENLALQIQEDGTQSLELDSPEVWPHPVAGPCLGKTYDLLPIPAGQTAGQPAFREMPSFRYSYLPTGEAAAGLEPGIFGIFPISGLALIKNDDGSVNEEAERHIRQAGLNYYQAEA